MFKICSKCLEEKHFNFFYNQKGCINGKRPECKSCTYKSVDKNKKRIADKKYRTKNKELKKQRDKQYYLNNKEKILNHHKIYMKNKRRQDVNYKLTMNLRSRFKSAFYNNAKKGSAIKDLGCSIEELKIYLESKFQDGMTWENYGQWHIDHIKPLSSFNLLDYEQVKIACHYTNLQPLWAIDNLRKSKNVG